MVTDEAVGVAVFHWKFTNPLPSVVSVTVVVPGAAVGCTHVDGGGEMFDAVMSSPDPGMASPMPLSGVTSTSLRTVIDGAQSWNAASRSAASSLEKSSSL